MKGARYKRRPYRNGYVNKQNREPRSSIMFAYNMIVKITILTASSALLSGWAAVMRL